MSAAFKAASNGDFETLKPLLESEDGDQLFSIVDWEGNNILHKAVIVNNVQCVRLIVDAFPLLTAQVNDKKRTPLHLACNLKADLNIIKILCEFKNTINIENRYGQTALFEALLMKRVINKINDGDSLEIIKILIENEADVYATGICGFTILHQAVFCNKFEEFKFLLNFGVKIDTLDDMKRTVLHLATMNERCEFLKFILEKDPKLVHIFDEGVSSPLLHASEDACENCVELLLQNEADVLQTNSSGQSCIELAIKSGKVKNVAKLLENGADPLVYNVDSYSKPPLQYACFCNYVEIVELLMKHESINRYVIDKKLGHPLVICVQNANPEILKLILNHPPFLNKSLTIDFPKKYNFISSGLVGYLLFIAFQRTRHTAQYYDQVLACFDLLLKENFPVNHANGSVSAITSLLLPFTSTHTHYNMLNIVKRLVDYGCDVYDMRLTNEFCEKYSINIELKNELQIPDALATAYTSGNEKVTKYLLRYWPHPPILLLLLCPSKSIDELRKWFSILIEFGWPTGNKFAKEIEELIHIQNEKDKIASLVQSQTPSSLKCLAKFASRNYLFEKKYEFGMSLPMLMQSLNIPATLMDDLLFVDRTDELEIAESTNDDDYYGYGLGLFD